MASTPRSLARSSGGSACQRASTASRRGRVRVDEGRRHQEVDRERPVRGAADGPDLVPQVVGQEADPAQAAEAARFADRGDERCLRHPGHARGRDGVLDPQEVGEGRPHAGRSSAPAARVARRSDHPGLHRVLGGEPCVQLRPHVRQPRRLGSAREAVIRSRSRSATTCSCGCPRARRRRRRRARTSGRSVPRRARPRPSMAPSAGMPQLPTRGAVTTKSGSRGRGRGWSSGSAPAPAVPRQRRAEDQVDPVEGQVPADLRELDVGADLDRDRGRTTASRAPRRPGSCPSPAPAA